MREGLTIVAWTWPFGSSLMLLWTAAAAIPIIIHLLNRLRYSQVAWAAMEYLLAALKKRSRRIRIEQWLLLLTRTLILLLLGLALADPLLRSPGANQEGRRRGGRTHWVLVLDGSYSMDYRENDKSRFQRAKEMAAELLDGSATGDGFTLILMSEPPQVIVGQVAFDPQDVRGELDNLQLTHGGADLAATLAEIEKVVRQAGQKHRRLKTHKVCLFTDLGQTTWGQVGTAECKNRLARLDEAAALVLFDLGNSDRENMAITRLATYEPLTTVGRPASFEIEIQNFGGQDRSDVTVELSVDGETIGQQQVDVAAGGRATISLPHRFATAGEHRVEARLAGDRLEVDNHRWLSVPVRQSIQVLCIGGSAGSARNVALALAPGDENETDGTGVLPRLATESALLEHDLRQFDCIFLCNVARLASDEATALREYLRDGGGLIFFLGDRVNADSYNRELGGGNGQPRLLPARLGNIISQAQYQFDPRDYRHPIVAPFRGYQQAGLVTTPVWKYFQLTPYDDDPGQVALAFAGGDPMIVEHRVLRGRSILVATAASNKSVDRSGATPRPWTLFATWPSFPPLVHQMLLFASQGRTAGRNVQIGDALEGWRAGAMVGQSLTVSSPSTGSEGEAKVAERVPLRVEGESSRWLYGETFVSGIYEARFVQPTSVMQLYAVNVNTLESDLQRYDEDLLPSQISRDLEEEDIASAAVDRESAPLFQYFLAAVLVLLFIETVIAWRFGRSAA